MGLKWGAVVGVFVVFMIFMHAQVSDDKAVFMHHEVSFLVRCRYVRRMDELTAVWHAAGELVSSA